MNNVIKRVWNQNRMVKIEDLCGMTFQAESGGHTFEVSGVNDSGATVSLSGTVEGRFLRADNAEIIIPGTASSGKANVTLTAACYAIPGRFLFTMYVTSGGQKTAVYSATGSVASTAGTAGGSIPPLVTDSVQAGSITTGNATVNGVLDVTNRRASKSLNTVGWKRVLNVGGGTGGFAYSGVIDLTITRSYTAANNESHKISLFINHDAACQFMGEESFSNTQIIDKIRYTKDESSNGHLDIHYNSTTQNKVTVDYVVHIDPTRQQYSTAAGLADVDDAPSGETVKATHNLTSNTNAYEAATKDENFSTDTFSLNVKRRGDILLYSWNIGVPALTASTWYNMGTFSNIIVPGTQDITWAGQSNAHYLIEFQTSGNVRIYSASASSAQLCRGKLAIPAN